MTPRSFFTILIKILGIYLVLDAFTVIPQFISTLSTFGLSGDDSGLTIALTLAMLLLTLGIYYLVLRFCVYKTDWIIDKLSLDKHFTEEKFELNIHRSTVLSIATIVIGALIFVDALPTFCKSVYGYIGQKQTTGRFGENPQVGWVIFYFIKIFIGYFMVTSQRLIVNFIERQRKTK